MNYCQLTSLVTGIANQMAKGLNEEQINFLGALFSQLGDTLETIAAQKALCEK